MSLDDFTIEEKLGNGSYATVYKVKKNAESNSYYALKKAKILSLNEKERENSLNEIRLMGSLRDRNIITYKECFLDHNSLSLCLIMEYADDGDLFEKIRDYQKKSLSLPEEEIWNIFIQIIFGLKALHDLNILHRDLKTANVFLFKDGTAKLGDFNVSKIAKNGFLKTQTGTPYYASPEVWKDVGYDKKSDIWSLGIILYEMANLHPPFLSDDLDNLSKKVIKGAYHKLSEHYSQDLHNILSELLQVSPEKRPTCEQLLSNKLIISRLKQENLFLLDEIKPEMLKTIKFPKNPKNFNYLSERLPLKNYNVLQCKMVKIEEFLENINGKIIIPNESTKKESIHAQLFPQIENNIAENTPILSKNKELSNEKKIRYKSSFNKKTLKNKKIASPSPMPKYVNHKIGRDFLLKPLNLKNEKIESGRKLFGKNDFHHKEHQENMEIHDYFHPKFDRQISTLKKIYGNLKNHFIKSEFTPLKLITPENDIIPMISSDHKKFRDYTQVDKLPKIQTTNNDYRLEKKIVKVNQLKEIMKVYKIDKTDLLSQKELHRYYNHKIN